LVWADGAVRNTWLRVTIKASTNTGLSTPDVFYVGSLVGEVGDSGSPWRVSATDLAELRHVLARPLAAGVSSAYDLNRDGRIDARDVAALRSNLFHTLRPITIPAVTAASAVVTRSEPATRQVLARRTLFT
jgi:hypothetical protein